MTRVLRVLLIVVAAIIVVAGAIAAYVALTFSPKDYLPVLTAAVREATGRELHSDGQIGLKLFPCCAVTLGETSLGNPAGFPPGDFARVRSAAVSLRLWPLVVRHEVQIGTVRLDGLAVELRERADGRTSWDFGAAGGRPGAESAPERGAPGAAAFTVSGLDIRAARLHYHNEKSGADYLVDDFDLSTGTLAAGKPADVEAKLRLTNVAGKLSTTLKFKTTLTSSGDGNTIGLRGPLLEITAAGAGLTGASLETKLRVRDATVTRGEDMQALFNDVGGEIALPGWKSPPADISGSFTIGQLRLASGSVMTVDIPAIEAKLHAEGSGIPGKTVDAKIAATKIAFGGGQALATIGGLEATLNGLGAALHVSGRGRVGGVAGAQLSGRLELEPVSPRSLFAVLGKNPPATNDPRALTRLSGHANWLLQPAFVGFSALDAQLDETHVTGSLRLPRAANAPLAFDLRLGSLDADRYRAGDDGAAAGSKSAPEAAESELPLETIRSLRMDGRLQVAELTWSKLHMTDVTTRVQAGAGRLRLDPLTAALYGGTLAGTVSVDASGPAARVAAEQRLSAFKVGPALRDIYKSDKLDGELSASLDFSAAGRTTRELWRSLAGPMSMHLSNGVYRGADLWYEIRRARALFKRTDPPPRPTELATPIASLVLEGTAKNGVLQTTQLTGRMPFTALTGAGVFDLADDTLDLRLKAQVVETPKFDDGGDLAELNGLAIPLTLKGAMTGPKVGVDYGSLVKSVVTDKVEKKAKEKLFKKFGDLLRQ